MKSMKSWITEVQNYICADIVIDGSAVKVGEVTLLYVGANSQHRTPASAYHIPRYTNSDGSKITKHARIRFNIDFVKRSGVEGPYPLQELKDAIHAISVGSPDAAILARKFVLGEKLFSIPCLQFSVDTAFSSLIYGPDRTKAAFSPEELLMFLVLMIDQVVSRIRKESHAYWQELLSSCTLYDSKGKHFVFVEALDIPLLEKTSGSHGAKGWFDLSEGCTLEEPLRRWPPYQHMSTIRNGKWVRTCAVLGKTSGKHIRISAHQMWHHEFGTFEEPTIWDTTKVGELARQEPLKCLTKEEFDQMGPPPSDYSYWDGEKWIEPRNMDALKVRTRGAVMKVTSCLLSHIDLRTKTLLDMFPLNEQYQINKAVLSGSVLKSTSRLCDLVTATNSYRVIDLVEAVMMCLLNIPDYIRDRLSGLQPHDEHGVMSAISKQLLDSGFGGVTNFDVVHYYFVKMGDVVQVNDDAPPVLQADKFAAFLEELRVSDDSRYSGESEKFIPGPTESRQFLQKSVMIDDMFKS